MTIRHFIGYFLLLVVLGGCGSPLGGQSQPTNFYILTPLVASDVVPPASMANKSIRIGSVILPPYLERPQITGRATRERLELAEYDRWGGKLGANFGRVLAENLSKLLGTPRVSAHSSRGAGAPDVVVSIEVIRFGREPDGSVLLVARWRLAGRRGVPALVRLTEHSRSAESGYDETVQAMSGVLGDFSKELAGALAK